MAGNLRSATERVDEQTVRLLQNNEAETTGNLFRLPLSRSGLTHRTLFLRWVVLQAVVTTLITAAAIAYGDQLHGASLVMVPLILIVLAGASGYAGLLAWRFDDGGSAEGGLRHLWFAAGVCQLLGLLGTVAGFYAMFNKGTSAASGTVGASSDLASRVTHGAGVALSATFIGILASIVILLEHHVLDTEP
jgi:MotA/TolQ/ExbB proton channel family